MKYIGTSYRFSDYGNRCYETKSQLEAVLFVLFFGKTKTEKILRFGKFNSPTCFYRIYI